MIKRICTLLFVLILVFSITACGDSNKQDENETKQEESGNTITVDPLDLGDDFNDEYYPVKSEIQQRSGQIDVVLKFEGTEEAWETLAKEYERLHSNAVKVNIINTYESNYTERLQQEVNDSKTTWDIVQGNLINNIESHCYNMTTSVRNANAYAGGKIWRKVLTKNAYQTDSSSSTVYMINSQNLQTCWFINTVAFEKAQIEATKDGVTIKQNPSTWDELMDVCKYMKKAGYSHPLGISLDDDSINGFQFSWLLRIYGDYYYRNQYNYIMMDSTYEVDVTSEDAESLAGYGYQVSKLYNVILAEEDDATRIAGGAQYVGAKSARYKEFVSQFVKIKDYIHPDAVSMSLETVRNKFKTQVDDNESPQIMLDYAGSGLAFDDVADTFSMDFFDYPYMVSEGGFIDEGTLLRDVGGSGGYLSILNHNTQQSELCLDFIKFAMSPYGQTIYYNALSQTDVAPKGITTVKNDLVIVPEKWTAFFNTDKISFSGLCDTDEFIRNLIRPLNDDTDSNNLAIKNWRKLLVGDQGSFMTSDEFCNEWHESLLKAWETFAAERHYDKNLYKTWDTQE